MFAGNGQKMLPGKDGYIGGKAKKEQDGESERKRRVQIAGGSIAALLYF
jgi:hypothetical protein